MMKTIAISITPQLIEKLKKESTITGLKISDIVRQCITKYFEKE